PPACRGRATPDRLAPRYIQAFRCSGHCCAPADQLALFEADDHPRSWNYRANPGEAAQLFCGTGIEVHCFVAGVGGGVESNIAEVVHGSVCTGNVGCGYEAEVSATRR